MSAALDDTHDPALQSWVESANRDGSDFTIQNLPFGRCERAGFRRIGFGECRGTVRPALA